MEKRVEATITFTVDSRDDAPKAVAALERLFRVVNAMQSYHLSNLSIHGAAVDGKPLDDPLGGE